MTLFLIFLGGSAALTGMIWLAARPAPGWLLPVWLGVFVLLHALYLLFLYLTALRTDPSKPLEKQDAVCRFGCGTVIGLVNFYLGIRVRFTGLDKLPEQGRFFLVCNHRSMFDPLIVIDKLRRWNISFISKPSNLRIPLIGRIAYAAGFLPIDRENDRAALKTILTAADYMKRDLCSMAVYPEGTRSRTGQLLPFHAGCFRAAQKAGVPLVTAAVRGTERVSKNFPWRRTEVFMDILEVLPPEQVKAMRTGELSDRCRDLIQTWLDREAPRPGVE